MDTNIDTDSIPTFPSMFCSGIYCQAFLYVRGDYVPEVKISNFIVSIDVYMAVICAQMGC
jgi:hypothetical protein